MIDPMEDVVVSDLKTPPAQDKPGSRWILPYGPGDHEVRYGHIKPWNMKPRHGGEHERNS